MGPPGDDGGLRSELIRTFEETGAQMPCATLVLGIVAIPMVLLHLYQAQTFEIQDGMFRAVHLTLCLVIVILAGLERTKARQTLLRAFLWLLAALAVVPLVYIVVEYDALVNERPFLPAPKDLVVGLILLVVTLAVAFRSWGWTIPSLAALGLLYGYFGYVFPDGLLFHAGVSIERLIGYTSIPYFRGLLGSLTNISASITFLFLVFAGMMKATGGLDYVMKLAFSLSRGSRAGPAQAAIVSSGFMGMISGSIMANVASTGAFTIPLMKRVGFQPAFAGAVETVASAAGQFTPPKMGLAAFLIVGLTGIPYAEIMVAAILPSVVVYAYLAVAVQVRAMRDDIHAGRLSREERERLPLAKISVGRATLLYGHLFIALAVLVWFLLEQYPPGAAALYGIVTLMALETLKILVINHRQPLHGLVEAVRVNAAGLVSGARGGASVAVVIATISVLVEMLVVTGFAQKLSHLMLVWSGDNLALLMLLAAATALAFGLGLPTSAAYVLVALLGAPALAELGVPLLAAHLFVFYLAIMSALTPPVATGALVAASIAGADFFRTAFAAVRLGLPGFLLPFIFVVRPEMLMLEGTLVDALIVTIAAFVGICALNFAIEGFMITRLSWLERLLMLPVAFGLLLPGWRSTLTGMVLFATVLAWQVWRHRTMPAPDPGGS